MSQKIIVATLLLTVMATNCRKRSDPPTHAGLRGISFIATIPGSSVNADIDSQNRVTFYINVQGRKEPVLSVDNAYSEGSIKGVKVSENLWRIEWMGVTIGEKRGEQSEICGPKFGYSEICDATFIQRNAQSKNGKNLLILGFLDKGFAQVTPGSANNSANEGLNLTTTNNDSFVDIAGHATTEINQNGTGTCLYNSTTGIIEWYRNKASGKVERLSAPYVLAKLFESSYTGEVGAVNATKQMARVVPDTVFPTQETYNQFTAFQSVYDYSQQKAEQIKVDQTIKIPALKGTQLFMLSLPGLGDFGAQGASQQQMNGVRDWLLTRKTPVHFFHYYYDTGIWHAVMALGWDDQRQLIKIKDSLSQSGRNGQWRSIASYQAMAYGAVGTESTDSSTTGDNSSTTQNQSGSTNSTPQNGGGTSSTNPTTPSTSSPTPTSNSSLLSELNWLAVIQGSMMYVYVSKDVSDVSIRVAGNKWLPLPNNYVAQPGIPTIRGIYINRPTWDTHTTVDVRVIYKGQYVAAQVPLQFR